MRILEVATEVPPHRGGISRVLEYLASGLRARGHRVDALGYPNVPRLRLGEVRVSAMLLRWRTLRAAARRADVLHVHGATPTVSDAALLLAATVRRRSVLVYTHHAEPSIGGLPFLGAIYARLHRRLSRLADETVCTSVEAASEFRDRPALVIPLGIDVRHFASGELRTGPFTALYVGQFRPWKAVPVLMRAISGLPGARLLVAGGGPEEHAYRDLAERLELPVEFHIGVDDEALHRIYERAHAIVAPSTARMEAFGLALLEGMAAGCVPVASDLPGVREVVDGAGFTVEPGSVDGLRAALRRLRDDPELLSDLRRRAQDRARLFSRDRMVAAYEHLFLDLLAARRLQAARESGRDPTAAAGEYLEDVGARVAATRVELWLRDGDGRLTRAAGVGHWPGPEVTRAAVEDGGSGDGGTPVAGTGPFMAAPLRQGGASLGTLVAVREEPFEPRDRLDWARAARLATRALATGG